jgi:hypothetical protein
MPKPRSPTERFWDHVRKTEGCWFWTAAKAGGYGQFSLRHALRIQSHRYAWLLEYGPIPEGVLVLHKCDEPLCVRPEHLFLGSHSDNSRDAFTKGRRTQPNHGQLIGERNGRAKLTADQVRAVHASKNSGRKLARELGVTAGAIHHIRQGRSWRHLLKGKFPAQGVLEYALVILLVALAVIVMMAVFGATVGNMFSTIVGSF